MRSSASLVIVTGMSGAGRSTAAKALEDMGWYVIDNLPPRLLGEVTSMITSDALAEDVQVAVVVDARSRQFFADLRAVLDDLRSGGLPSQILFLEASDDVLVRRQEAARRPHPLQQQGRLLDGIKQERELIRELRADADLVVDTSQLNVHQLTARVNQSFTVTDDARPYATVVSFGFKYGIPVDADMVLDMRFLPNPYWDPELRHQTGLDPDVQTNVLSQPDAKQFLGDLDRMLTTVFGGFERERKVFFNIAIGCTGGRHRSVAMAEEVAARMRARGTETLVVHRDLGRE